MNVIIVIISLMMKYIIRIIQAFFFLLQTLCFYSENVIKIDPFLKELNNYKWKNEKMDPGTLDKNLDIIKKINVVLDRINKNPALLSGKEISKISEGHLRINGSIDMLFDYSEILDKTILYFIYHDLSSDLTAVFKDYHYVYFIDGSKKTANNHVMKLNSLLFESDDFNVGGYTTGELQKSIDSSLYKSAIITKNDIYPLYDRWDNSWKKFIINPDNDRMMFKPDVEFELKFEIPIAFVGTKPKPAKLYPTWLKYSRKINSPPETSEYFNELITIPNFYEVWTERMKFAGTRVEPDAQITELLRSTRESRLAKLDEFEKKNIFNLSGKNIASDNGEIVDKKDHDIVLLNRLLLERTCPYACPRICGLNFLSEKITGDIDDYIDDGSIKLLLSRNMKLGMYVEKNKEIKSILDEKNEPGDEDTSRYQSSIKLKKIMDGAEIFSFDFSCGKNDYFDIEKYFDIDNLLEINVQKKDLSYINNKDIKKTINYKSTIAMKFFYRVLNDRFEKGISGGSYKFLSDILSKKLSDLFDYYDGKILIDSKYYDKGQINDLSVEILRLCNLKIKNEYKTMEMEKWEIPVIFIKIDKGLFTGYFLDYEKK